MSYMKEFTEALIRIKDLDKLQFSDAKNEQTSQITPKENKLTTPDSKKTNKS